MQNPLYPEIKGKFSIARIDNTDVVDPKLKPIVDLIQIPYKFFGNICGNKNEILIKTKKSQGIADSDNKIIKAKKKYIRSKT